MVRNVKREALEAHRRPIFYVNEQFLKMRFFNRISSLRHHNQKMTERS
jgi:hypothetical protein